MAANDGLEAALSSITDELDTMKEKPDDCESEDSFDSAFEELEEPPTEADTFTSDRGEVDSSEQQPCSDHQQQLAQDLVEEHPEMRAAAVESFRTWVKEESGVFGCRLDDVFLLRFLRMAKFDMENAQLRFRKYFLFRRSAPNWIRNLDIEEDGNLMRLVAKGVLFVLPERDDEGRRVIFNCSEKIDASLDRARDMIRLYLLTFEALLEDEQSQIRGVVHVNDGQGVTFAKAAAWSPFEMKIILKDSQKAYPLRHKMIHIVNLPSWAGYLASFIRHSMTAKMRERLLVHLHGMEEVCQYVPRRILPKEYGGTVPMTEMAQKWLEELKIHRESILALDDAEIVDHREKCSWNFMKLFQKTANHSRTPNNHSPLKQQHSSPELSNVIT